LAPSKSDRNERAEPIANLPFAQEIQIHRALGILRVGFNDDWYEIESKSIYQIQCAIFHFYFSKIQITYCFSII